METATKLAPLDERLAWKGTSGPLSADSGKTSA